MYSPLCNFAAESQISNTLFPDRSDPVHPDILLPKCFSLCQRSEPFEAM